MSSRAERLQPAVDQARQRSEDALARFAAQQQQLARAEHQLSELHRYRDEYANGGDAASRPSSTNVSSTGGRDASRPPIPPRPRACVSARPCCPARSLHAMTATHVGSLSASTVAAKTAANTGTPESPGTAPFHQRLQDARGQGGSP